MKIFFQQVKALQSQQSLSLINQLCLTSMAFFLFRAFEEDKNQQNNNKQHRNILTEAIRYQQRRCQKNKSKQSQSQSRQLRKSIVIGRSVQSSSSLQKTESFKNGNTNKDGCWTKLNQSIKALNGDINVECRNQRNSCPQFAGSKTVEATNKDKPPQYIRDLKTFHILSIQLTGDNNTDQHSSSVDVNSQEDLSTNPFKFIDKEDYKSQKYAKDMNQQKLVINDIGIDTELRLEENKDAQNLNLITENNFQVTSPDDFTTNNVFVQDQQVLPGSEDAEKTSLIASPDCKAQSTLPIHFKNQSSSLQPSSQQNQQSIKEQLKIMIEQNKPSSTSLISTEQSTVQRKNNHDAILTERHHHGKFEDWRQVRNHNIVLQRCSTQDRTKKGGRHSMDELHLRNHAQFMKQWNYKFKQSQKRAKLRKHLIKMNQANQSAIQNIQVERQNGTEQGQQICMNSMIVYEDVTGDGMDLLLQQAFDAGKITVATPEGSIDEKQDQIMCFEDEKDSNEVWDQMVHDQQNYKTLEKNDQVNKKQSACAVIDMSAVPIVSKKHIQYSKSKDVGKTLNSAKIYPGCRVVKKSKRASIFTSMPVLPEVKQQMAGRMTLVPFSCNIQVKKLGNKKRSNQITTTRFSDIHSITEMYTSGNEWFAPRLEDQADSYLQFRCDTEQASSAIQDYTK